MATVEELLIKLAADNRDLKNKLAESEKSVGSFGGYIKKLGPMIAGAFSVAAIVAFGKASFVAFEEQDKANRRLLFALKGNQSAFKTLTDQAGEFQSLTGVADDQIQQIQMLAAQSGKTTSEIKKITEATINLAAATGQDLQSAYMQLNMTFSGSAGRLGKLDKDFTALTQTQLENGAAIDLVLSKYKGFAAESATQIEKLKANWDELKENIGGVVAPAFNSFFSKLNRDLAITSSNTLSWREKFTLSRESAEALTKERNQIKENRIAWAVYDYSQTEAFKNRVKERTKEILEERGFGEAVKKSTEEIKDQKTALELYIEKMEELYEKQQNWNDFSVPNGTVGMFQSNVSSLSPKGIKTGNTDPLSLQARYADNTKKAIDGVNKSINTNIALLESSANMMANMGSAAQMAFGEESAAYKTFAIAQATISTYLAATAALAPPPMGYGPVAGIPAAIGIVGMGIANIAHIMGAFADGGIVGGNSMTGDKVVIRANSGEMVLNAAQQANLFAIANGRGGGSQRIEVFGTIRAGDIYLSNERGKYLKQRRG